jgi:hypothetical protein
MRDICEVPRILGEMQPIRASRRKACPREMGHRAGSRRYTIF